MGRRFLQGVDPLQLQVTGPLFTWYRRYAQRHVRPANVAVVGDSIAFGSGTLVGATPDVTNYLNTMIIQLSRMLNDLPSYFLRPDEALAGSYNPGAGGGYCVPTRLVGQGIADPWRVAAGTVTSISRGMGLRSLQINAASRLAFTAPSASGFLWWYEDGASNLGTPAVSIYAGDYNATRTGRLVDNFALPMTPALPQYARTWGGSIQLPGRGKWTIEFSPTSGTPVLDMIYVLDGDLNNGVRVYNCAFGSQLSGDFAANNTAANTAATATRELDAFATDGIDLLVIYLGANDYSNNITPAAFQTNLETIIDKYRATQTRTIPVLLVGHFARYDQTLPTYPWSQYLAAMRAVTQTRTMTDYLSLAPLFPASQAADTDGDLVDSSGVHLSAAGQGLAAQAIASRLTFPAVV